MQLLDHGLEPDGCDLPLLLLLAQDDFVTEAANELLCPRVRDLADKKAQTGSKARNSMSIGQFVTGCLDSPGAGVESMQQGNFLYLLVAQFSIWISSNWVRKSDWKAQDVMLLGMGAQVASKDNKGFPMKRTAGGLHSTYKLYVSTEVFFTSQKCVNGTQRIVQNGDQGLGSDTPTAKPDCKTLLGPTS